MNNRAADYGALTLRVALGVMYLAHAGLKIFTFSLAGTAAFFEAHGFPGWSVYPVVTAEVVGGLMLILGVLAPWVAMSLVPILLAAATVHLPNGWVFSNEGGGWEYPIFLAVASLVQWLIGSGAHALKPTLSSAGSRSPA
ncbi:DoxX family protein [Ferruginivarius sediminum]|uniref:DoxX family protein n=1 Tax=Ferruginivarius sediminum TaxID=2661937 RepID=A0A369TL20_9PROT|nr:DoxX family protein [Ferruginivarius sediminum]RDD63596.1 DoxX family protein [Ferruginivarius sediminum]